MAKIGFSSKGKEKMNDFSSIPADDYVVEIIKSEMKKTKNYEKTGGECLNIHFKVLEGEYSGRLLFSGLNLINNNPQTVEIAEKELATIVAACGKDGDDVDESEELHGIPMLIKVVVKPATSQYPEKNEIKFYEEIEGDYTAPSNPDDEEVSEKPKTSGKKKISFD